jgi:hypothetical protein
MRLFVLCLYFFFLVFYLKSKYKDIKQKVASVGNSYFDKLKKCCISLVIYLN